MRAQAHVSHTRLPVPPPQGIIHRDIKSSNIFMGAHGILKLGDFGVSKALAPGKSFARTMVGTPFYVSPEIVEVRRTLLKVVHSNK
jgi:serine/threonine protein kinase